MDARTHCVICKSTLEFVFTRENFPITASPPSKDHFFKNDLYSDQKFYKCNNCSCIQLGTLIDPNVLYENPHNDTYNTPTWKLHHNEFGNFVLKSVSSDIFEIGGHGIIHGLIQEKQINLKYSILDICEPTSKIDNITYLSGNCEDYKFQKNKTIVMSHVFEHLFNPRKFVENIDECGVASVYISIPHMEYMVNSNCPVILHNEHTFYIDKKLIEWVFSQHNYEVADYSEFKNHSIFLHFKRNIGASKASLRINNEVINKLIKSLNPTFNVSIKENSFICPAGLYGQLLMYYFKDSKILGVLDNDKAKQNLRVYGTPYFVFPFDELLRHNNITVYLMAGLYNKEIITQIKSYNKNFEIIEITLN